MIRIIAALIAFTALAATAVAENFPPSCQPPHAICLSGYCPKPLPCLLPPILGCCPDHYCRKPLPCVPPPVVGCCDAYCRKPLPWLCPPATGCIKLPACFSANHDEGGSGR
jgi:hypothetical protein